MFRLRHKACIAIFKGFIGLVGVILLSSQLSYKFYQYASLPPGEGCSIANAFIPAVKAPGTIPGYDSHHNKVFLSLDKRYDLAHIYYLPASIIHPTIPPFIKNDYVFRRQPKPVSRINLQASLRAPPIEML